MGGKYDNPEVMLNSESLQLQQVLLQLSMSIQDLNRTNREMVMSQQIGQTLASANQTGASFDQAMAMSVQTKEAFMSQQIAPIMQQLQQYQTQVASINQQMDYLRNNMVSADAIASNLSREQMQTQASLYTSQYQRVMAHVASSFAYSQYFGNEAAILQPGLNDLAPGTVLPYQLQNSIGETYRLQMDLAPYGPSDEQVARYHTFASEMYKQSQQASANYLLSSKLGVPSRGMAAGEFSGGVMPALNEFSYTTGMNISDSIDFMKRLKSLQAISADLSTGMTSDVVLGIEQTEQVIKKLSRLIKSSDLKDLMGAAATIASFGGGSYESGLNVLGRAGASNFQTPDMQNLGELINSPFVAQYGANAAGLGAAMFNQSLQNTMQNYGSFDTAFRMLGGSRSIAARVANDAAKFTGSTTGYLTAVGGGDIFRGADVLAGSGFSDPASFLLNTAVDRFSKQEMYSGFGGYVLKEELVQNLKDMGLTNDEALMTAYGGDINSVLAHKQYISSMKSETERFANRLRVGESYRRLGGFREEDASEILRKNAGNFGLMMGVTQEEFYNNLDFSGTAIGRGVSYGISRIGYDITRPFELAGKSVSDFFESAFGVSTKATPIVTTSGTIGLDAYQGKEVLGFFNPNGPGVVRLTDTGVASLGTLSKESVGKTNIISILAAASYSEGARKVWERLANRIVATGTASEQEVKNMLREGIITINNSGILTQSMDASFLREVFNYIRNNSLRAIYNDLKGAMPLDHPVVATIGKIMGDSTAFEVSDPGKAADNLLRQYLAQGITGTTEFETAGFIGEGPANTLMAIGEKITPSMAVSAGIIGGATAIGAGVGLLGAGIGVVPGAAAGFAIGSAIDTVASAPGLVATGLGLAQREVENFFGLRFDKKEFMEEFITSVDTQTESEIKLVGGLITESIENIERSNAVVQTIVTQYRVATQRNNKKSLQQNDIAQIVDSIANNFKLDPRQRNAVAIVLQMLNQDRSELGKILRQGSDNTTNRVRADIQKFVTENNNTLLGIKDSKASDLMQGLLDTAETKGISTAATAKLLVDTASLRSAAQEGSFVGDLYKRISTATYSGGRTAEDAKASLQSLIQYAGSTGDQNFALSDLDYKLLEETFGKTDVQALKSTLEGKATSDTKRAAIGKFLQKEQREQQLAEEQGIVQGQLLTSILYTVIRDVLGKSGENNITDEEIASRLKASLKL